MPIWMRENLYQCVHSNIQISDVVYGIKDMLYQAHDISQWDAKLHPAAKAEQCLFLYITGGGA